MHHKTSETPTLFTMLKNQGFTTISISPVKILNNRGFKGIDMCIPFRSRKLKKVISGLNGGRFFAFLHYWDVHTPYETLLPGLNPPDKLLNIARPLDRFKDVRFIRLVSTFRIRRIRAMMEKNPDSILPAVKTGYRNAIITADKYMGSILKIIEKTGVADKTLLVITGDHGDSFNEHNEIKRAVGRRYEHGQFLYGNIIKVPMIFFQSKENFQRKSDMLVQRIDMIPTILDALGIDCNGNIDGKSLWNYVTGKKSNSLYKFVFSEAVRESLDMELRAVRSINSKLICDYKNNSFELFDLKTDPQEQNNLWCKDHSEKEVLLSELQTFSQIGSDTKAHYSEEEQQQIEDTLRSLGYID